MFRRVGARTLLIPKRAIPPCHSQGAKKRSRGRESRWSPAAITSIAYQFFFGLPCCQRYKFPDCSSLKVGPLLIRTLKFSARDFWLFRLELSCQILAAES
ncbi:hypothetical protein BJX64DRAFT_266422 [Aspergillus heterothallicus]